MRYVIEPGLDIEGRTFDEQGRQITDGTPLGPAGCWGHTSWAFPRASWPRSVSSRCSASSCRQRSRWSTSPNASSIGTLITLFVLPAIIAVMVETFGLKLVDVEA